MDFNRRNFIKNTAIAAAAVSVVPTVLNACASPGEMIKVGLIGCRSMGWNDLMSFLKEGNNTECVALCDVDKKVLDDRAAQLEKQISKKQFTVLIIIQALILKYYKKTCLRYTRILYLIL